MTTLNLEELAGMSDAEIDQALAAKLLGSEGFTELAVENGIDTSTLVAVAEGAATAAPDAPAPSRIDVYDPMTGQIIGDDDDAEEIDPDSVTDDAVADSVTGHTSSVDHDALAKYYDYADGDDEEDGSPFDTGGYGAPDPDDDDDDDDDNSDDDDPADDVPVAAFVPARPDLPDADTDAEPTLDPVLNTVESRPSRSIDAVGKAKGGVDSAKKWFTGQSSRNRAMMIAAAIFVVIIGVIVVTRGGDDPAPTAREPGHGAVDSQEPDTGDDVPGKPVVLNDRIKTVSAECADPSTSPALAFSTEKSDAWVCTRSHGIDGSILNITFVEPVQIDEIRFMPGFDYIRQPSGDDAWLKHRVTVRAVWRMGGRQITQEIAPARSEAVLTLDEPITTQEMSLTIQASVEPDGSNDGGMFSTEATTADATAIQNIEITGRTR